MEEKPRFAGHRLIRFSPATREALAEIAERLIPHTQSILDRWVSQQFDTWEPPNFTRESLGVVFGNLLGGILRDMRSGELEACVESLEQAGMDLAELQFPFDALIISVHFLEASYMPVLLNPTPANPRRWLVTMDEFLHVVLAALANAYFEAYRRELLDRAEVGRIVQEGLMPHIPKAVADLEVAYTYKSARDRAQLGGDFLDSFESTPGEFCFVIGDLSGHGLDAAADSVMLRSVFRGFMRERPDLADAMQRLNRVLCADLRAGQFATALALTYQPGGRITMVNAGHPYPIVRNEDCRLVKAEGMALGIDEAQTYGTVECELEVGGIFVAYTDGIVEARRKGDLFGDDRLLSVVSSMRGAPARAIVEQIVDEAQRHAGGKFSDDVAVLVMRRLDARA